MATIQDLIREQNVSQDVSDVNFLIKRLLQEQKEAQLEDKEFKEKIRKGGKTIFSGIKTKKDFLAAKRFKPDLKFKDFLLDPKTSAQYMKEGIESIVRKESLPITMREIFGFGPKTTDTGTVNVGRNFLRSQPARPFGSARSSFELDPAKPMSTESLYSMARDSSQQSIPMAQETILPDVEVPSLIPPKMGDVTNQGLQNMLSRGRLPIVPEVRMASPSQTASMTKMNPVQFQPVDVVGTSRQAIRRAGSAGVENLGIEKVKPSTTVGEATGRMPSLGTAGRALGAVGSVGALASGLKDITSGRGDLSAIAKTAGGAAGIATLLTGANPLLGAGLNLLSLISGRRR
jgi:hypothetical protein|tara:strand:- start:466 stop:1503 length:1038 start_codon:yes stop_codon:yes gene_type:complete